MNKDEHTSMMVERLGRFYASDGEQGLGAVLLRSVHDPLKPQKEDGTIRFNPILIFLAFLGILEFGTFLLFSLEVR